MADENTTPAEAETQPTTQPEAETTEDTQETSGNEPQKVLTQEQVDKLLARRLERERAKLRGEWETEKAEAEKQAKMSALEKAQVKEQKAAARIQELEAELAQERRTYSLERQLAGKVVNAKASIKLIGDYVAEDGTADLEAFFADYPEQKPSTQTPQRGVNGRTLASGGAEDANAVIRRAMGY